ncbi:hypothetical protein ACFL2O_07125 [Thermodesulfobacteriota bacterium]
MPMELKYLPDGGVLMKADGFVTFKDIKGVNDEIYSTEEKILGISYQLCDFTNVKGFPLSSEEVKTIAEQDRYAAKINPKMIIATIGELDVIYGLSRMWQAFTDGSSIKTKVFRNMADAEKWIKEKLSKSNSERDEKI